MVLFRMLGKEQKEQKEREVIIKEVIIKVRKVEEVKVKNIDDNRFVKEKIDSIFLITNK
jgi:hypothetical protein